MSGLHRAKERAMSEIENAASNHDDAVGLLQDWELDAISGGGPTAGSSVTTSDPNPRKVGVTEKCEAQGCYYVPVKSGNGH